MVSKKQAGASPVLTLNWIARARHPLQCDEQLLPRAGGMPKADTNTDGKCWKYRKVCRYAKSKMYHNPFCPKFPREHWCDLRGNWYDECKGQWCCSAGGGFWRTDTFIRWPGVFVVWCVCSLLAFKFLQKIPLVLLMEIHEVKESKKMLKDGQRWWSCW